MSSADEQSSAAESRADLTADGAARTEDAATEDKATEDKATEDKATRSEEDAPQEDLGQDGLSQDGDRQDEEGGGEDEPAPAPAGAARGRFTFTRVLVALLLALLGFSLAVQVRSVATDPTLAALGQEDLVRILANLDAHEERLRSEIAELEETKRRLTTAGQSQQEALAEAERRADELGILAGTLPAEGPGLVVRFRGGPEAVNAARLLDAVQELRGAGAEAMQLEAGDGTNVRVVASTYFVDVDGAIVVDGARLASPYTLTVIGEPQTLAPALNLPGGVVETVHRGGGTVTVHEEPGGVEVTALRTPKALQHARPAA